MSGFDIPEFGELESLWVDDPSRDPSVPVERILPRLAACFREWYRPQWDEQVPQAQVGREWYLSRSEGLAAYGRYEADLRLRQAGRTAFTRGDFVLWFLGELAQIIGWKDAITNPIFDDLMLHRRDLLTPNTLEKLIDRSRSPRGGNPCIRRYAMAYDRYQIPCEFWTDEAVANFLSCSYVGSSTFSVGDLVDLQSLAGKLKGQTRTFDIWLAGRLSSATRAALASYQGPDSDPAMLQEALLQDLNALLKGASIYEQERFAEIALRLETQILLSQNPQGSDLQRLNRLMIEDAFPLELSRNPYDPRTERVLPLIPYDPNYGFKIKPTTEEQVRSWRRMLKLDRRKPVVVKGFRARTKDEIDWEFVFVEDTVNAMGVHGIPTPDFDRK